MALAAFLLWMTVPPKLPLPQPPVLSANEVCRDSGVRQAAADAIGVWAQNYPFARVIIGDEGKFGEVSSPQAYLQRDGYVICAGHYLLTRIGSDGHGYTVSITRFTYKVEMDGAEYRVSLDDLPSSLEGSGYTSRDLIDRFYINGRAYADILGENQLRLQRRGN